MALRLKSGRCKSTTDILNENSSEKQSLWVKSPRVNKSHSTEELNSSRKKSNVSKSQGLINRLMITLGKRNESCQANDEFWATYYKSSGGYQCFQNDKLACIGCEPKEQLRALEEQDCTLRQARRLQHRFQSDENLESLRRFPRQRPKSEWNHRVEDRSRMRDKSTRSHAKASLFNEDMLHREDQRGGSLNRNLACKGSSELAASRETERVCTAEIERGGGSMTLHKNSKKVSRKKSFKKFLGSVMKWGRSGNKEEPRRFLSCDDLTASVVESKVRCFEELSKTLSLEAVALLDENRQKRMEECVKSARAVYDDRRPINLPRIRVEKEAAPAAEGFTDLNIEETAESLVKPSAIKDIAKRFSQYQGRSCPRKY